MADGVGSAVISRTTRRFRELLAALPQEVQRLAHEAYRKFKDDPAHRGLAFKKVFEMPPTYSARIGRSYRTLGVREGDEIMWFWIGTHAEYDLLLKRL